MAPMAGVGQVMSDLASHRKMYCRTVPSGNGVVPNFDEHIRPLFRALDRQSMKSAFDLWSYTDVTTHAAAILHQLSTGSMPCDGAWPAERVAVLRRWIDAGMPK